MVNVKIGSTESSGFKKLFIAFLLVTLLSFAARASAQTDTSLFEKTIQASGRYAQLNGTGRGSPDDLFAYYVALGQSNMRIGNAVLVRIIHWLRVGVENHGLDTHFVLVGCDGTWIARSFVGNFDRMSEWLSVDQDGRYGPGKWGTSSRVMRFENLENVNHPTSLYVAQLGKLAPTLCTTARREEEGLDIPLTFFPKGREGVTGYWLQSGTLQSDSGRLSIRIKQGVVREFDLSAGGKVLKDEEGKPVRDSVFERATGLIDVDLSCKDRVLRISRIVDLDQRGAVAQIRQSESAAFFTPRPYSSGMAIIDQVCKIYGE